MPVSLKRFRDSLKTFQQYLREHYQNRVIFHHHEPHYNPMAWTDDLPSYSKGIVDDTILILADTRSVTGKKVHGRYRTHDTYDSIGFTFNPDQDGLSVRFSIKEGEAVRYSNPFSGEVFRTALNGINRHFRKEGVPESRKALIECLEAFFMSNPELAIKPQQVGEELDRLLGDERQIIPALNEKIAAGKTDLITAHNKLGHIKERIKSEIQVSAEQMKIDRLKKEIKEIEKVRDAKKKALFEKLEGPVWESMEKEAEQTVFRLQKERRVAVNRLRDRALGEPTLFSRVQTWIESQK